MKNCLLIIAFLTFSPSVLNAKDEDIVKKITGWWKSSEGDHYCAFETDGTYRVVGEDMDMKGNWKEGQKKGTISITMTIMGEKLDSTAEVKLDGDLKLHLVVEDGKKTYTRPKLVIDRKAIIGTWKGQNDDEEDGVSTRTVYTYLEDGNAQYKAQWFSNKHKIYCLNEASFKWSCSSGYLVEIEKAEDNEENDENEFIGINVIESVSPDKISSKGAFDGDSPYEMHRTKEYVLPAPPEGFKKVSPEEFNNTVYPEESQEDEVTDE